MIRPSGLMFRQLIKYIPKNPMLIGSNVLQTKYFPSNFELSQNIHIDNISKKEIDNLKYLEFTNNRKIGQNHNDYCKQSFNQLKQHMNPNSLFIIVDRSSVIDNAQKKRVHPGHFAIGITNNEANIIENSFISARPNLKNKIEDVELEYESPLNENFRPYTMPIDTSILEIEKKFNEVNGPSVIVFYNENNDIVSAAQKTSKYIISLAAKQPLYKVNEVNILHEKELAKLFSDYIPAKKYVHNNPVWKLINVSSEEEFKNHLFKINPEKEIILFQTDLVNILESLKKDMLDFDESKSIAEHLIDQAMKVKEEIVNNNSLYILCKGKMKYANGREELRDSFNCVIVAMLALGVEIEGVDLEENPSTQMLLRGILILLNKKAALKLIEETKLSFKNDFRKYDIELKWTKKTV